MTQSVCKFFLTAVLLLAGADAFAPSKSFFSRFPSASTLRAEGDVAAEAVQAITASAAPIITATPPAPAIGDVAAEAVQAITESAAPIITAAPPAPAIGDVAAEAVQAITESAAPIITAAPPARAVVETVITAAPPAPIVERIILEGAATLQEPISSLDTIALVVGQENYGLAVVLLGEGIWSLSKAPSIEQFLKTLLPSAIAAAVLVLVSGPMVTSGDLSQTGTGLFVATAVSITMGLIYLARCLSSFSPSPKEIPALGLLVSVLGFFSFSENLIVDGFVTLPQLPQMPPIGNSIPLPPF